MMEILPCHNMILDVEKEVKDLLSIDFQHYKNVQKYQMVLRLLQDKTIYVSLFFSYNKYLDLYMHVFKFI